MKKNSVGFKFQTVRSGPVAISKRENSAVALQVIAKQIQARERVPALLTYIWFLSCMFALVNFQRRRLSAAIRTVLAFIWFLARVFPHGFFMSSDMSV
ncbi:hypothetical protein M8J76_017255 [Diaphorina citri]|nr:hypothetical protein M8J76_017255 [Diaphorina citri]KAI5721428.1 hypothetical protein M8J77_020670 [Diaphorina citri]